jgi:hypothetical protein
VKEPEEPSAEAGWRAERRRQKKSDSNEEALLEEASAQLLRL